MPNNQYPALSVTVTNTIKNLYKDLLAVADTTIAPRGREITVQNDPASAVNIRVGSSTVSPTNCGYVLTPGASRTYRSAETYAVALAQMYVVTDSGTAQLNVEIVPR